MKKDPLISVIVPIYNADKFLSKCIESIVRQTYENLEILLINDGSSDLSGEICDKYASKDDRIVVIHQENKGRVEARNKGLEIAKSEYICFIDADDWIESEYIRYLYDLMIKNEVDVASCKFVRDFPDGAAKIDSYYVGTVLFTAKQAIMSVNDRRLEPTLCGKLFLKKSFEKVIFRDKVSVGEDYAVLMQILLKSSKMEHGDRPLYHYIQHFESTCYSGYKGNGFEIIDSYLEVKNMVLKQYPDLKKNLLKYHVLEEMAIITSMAKNDRYDTEVISRVRNDLKGIWKEYLFISKVPVHLKVCCVLIVMDYRLLTVPYKYLFKWRYRVKS